MRLNMRRCMVLAWPHPKEGDPLGGAHYSFYMVAICGVEVVVGKLRNMRLLRALLYRIY